MNNYSRFNSMSPTSCGCNNNYSSRTNDFSDDLSCPFENDTLNAFPVAMAYVPWQYWNEIYDYDKALCRGTLFPELDKPFLKGGCRK